MQIAIRFNEPAGEDKVTVKVGSTVAEDDAREFRVGFMKPDAPNAVHWSLLGWMKGDDPDVLRQLALEVGRGDLVKVERRDPDGRVTFFDVDTDVEWPGTATGDTVIEETWGFED